MTDKDIIKAISEDGTAEDKALAFIYYAASYRDRAKRFMPPLIILN